MTRSDLQVVVFVMLQEAVNEEKKFPCVVFPALIHRHWICEYNNVLLINLWPVCNIIHKHINGIKLYK